MSMQPGLFSHLVEKQYFKVTYKEKIVYFDNQDKTLDEDEGVKYISPDNPFFVDIIVEAIYESGMFSESELDEFSVIDDEDLAKLVEVA